MRLVTENPPDNRRGFYGASAQAGAATGMVLANLAFIAVSTSMSEQDFASLRVETTLCRQHRSNSA